MEPLDLYLHQLNINHNITQLSTKNYINHYLFIIYDNYLSLIKLLKNSFF